MTSDRDQLRCSERGCGHCCASRGAVHSWGFVCAGRNQRRADVSSDIFLPEACRRAAPAAGWGVGRAQGLVFWPETMAVAAGGETARPAGKQQEDVWGRSDPRHRVPIAGQPLLESPPAAPQPCPPLGVVLLPPRTDHLWCLSASPRWCGAFQGSSPGKDEQGPAGFPASSPPPRVTFRILQPRFPQLQGREVSSALPLATTLRSPRPAV